MNFSTKEIFNKYMNQTCLSFSAYNYQDWKEKEKQILEEYPNSRCVSLPGLGYAGEFWYTKEE